MQGFVGKRAPFVIKAQTEPDEDLRSKDGKRRARPTLTAQAGIFA